jgi:hypothetical protein
MRFLLCGFYYIESIFFSDTTTGKVNFSLIVVLCSENIYATMNSVLVVFVWLVKKVERCLKDDESGSGELQSMPSGFHQFFE